MLAKTTSYTLFACQFTDKPIVISWWKPESLSVSPCLFLVQEAGWYLSLKKITFRQLLKHDNPTDNFIAIILLLLDVPLCASCMEGKKKWRMCSNQRVIIVWSWTLQMTRCLSQTSWWPSGKEDFVTFPLTAWG